MPTHVTIISDTHDRHDELDLPGGDLLIHCGDMFNLFSASSQRMADIDAWFGRQRYARILCTGGNHDRELEAALTHRAQPLNNAQFLRDAGVEFNGLTIYGAPWVPDLPRHAFYQRRAGLTAAWAQVPAGVDILVTHTLPANILDASSRGQSLGCVELAAELGRIAPRVHCFGHVHASAGEREFGGTRYINASSIESGTGRMRPPITFTLSSRTG